MTSCASWQTDTWRTEASGNTLTATALVHEAYLRLVGDQHFENRGHFFAAASEAMRRVLVDRARDRKRQKRGGPARRREDLDLDTLARLDAPPDDLLDLDAALARLEQHDLRAAALVKLRVFAGLSLDEAAAALGVVRRTADCDWAFAPERSAYLDDACRGGAALRAQVEELLAAFDGAGRFLAHGPRDTTTADPATVSQDAPGILVPASHGTLEGISHAETPGTLPLSGQSGTDGNQTALSGNAPPSSSQFGPGQVIAGRYKVLEILGEGGMGAVYRAEQSQPVKRQVALKLIKTGPPRRSPTRRSRRTSRTSRSYRRKS